MVGKEDLQRQDEDTGETQAPKPLRHHVALGKHRKWVFNFFLGIS